MNMISDPVNMADFLEAMENTNDSIKKKEMVNHPDHYQSNKGLEVIQVMEAFTEGQEGIEAICTGNVLKYICRWKKKNGIQDLKKAEWYLQRLIRHMELVKANIDVEKGNEKNGK